MNLEKNKEMIRKLHEIWNTGNLEMVEEIFAPDFVAHFPQSSELPERRGMDGVRRGILRIRAAFPDWYEEIKDLIAEGDRVVSRYTSRGTHRGEFWGIPPTGRRISVEEISIFRIAKGKVAEQWCSIDELGRLQQLGVISTFCQEK